jgi:DNA-binding NarL/FixJ family response regulator
MKQISVLLADDHTVVRQGLCALLEAQSDIKIVGEAANGRQAVDLAKKTLPDVVLMDLAMPVLNGLEATRQIRRNVPSAKVLVLTSYDDDQYVQQIVQAGASGYLIKQTAANDLLGALRSVQQGNNFYSPAIARRLRQHNRDGAGHGPTPSRGNELTPRETEVLQLIAEGLPNKQIAARLEISVKTVEKHRQQVMNKLNIHHIAGLTRYSMSKGWIERQVAPALGPGSGESIPRPQAAS